MKNNELLTKLKETTTYLENAKTQLTNAKNILKYDLTFNGTGFSTGKIDDYVDKINSHIDNIKKNIIQKIEKV